MRSSQQPLKKFVFRVLTRRLLIAALSIMAVFAAISFVTQYDNIGDDIVDAAVHRIEILQTRADVYRQSEGLDDVAALRRAVEQRPVNRLWNRYGRFVYAQFFRADGTQLVEITEPDHSGLGLVRDYMQRSGKQHQPAKNRFWHDSVELGGSTYIHVVVPVLNEAGDVDAFGEGLLALSEEAMAQIRRRMIQVILYVMAIVLVTTAVLYPVVITLARKLARFSAHLLDANLETLKVLGSAVAKRDSDTDAHNYRVTIYAVRLAEAVGLPVERIQGLIKGAFLHDVGKIGIRDQVLLKPGKLSDEEFTIMQTHVEHGLEIVEQSVWLHDATRVVGGHHEKFDGSGYPKRQSGHAIPEEARIFAVADVFDALTSKRPYKEPFSYGESMEILEQGRGSHFDPELLDTFIRIADPLYRRLSGKDDDTPRQEVQEIIEQYFTQDMASLVY